MPHSSKYLVTSSVIMQHATLIIYVHAYKTNIPKLRIHSIYHCLIQSPDQQYDSYMVE